MDAPDVRYAQSGPVNIAYQVLGGGEVDLLYVAGWISHLDLYWEEPTVARFLRRLGSGFRLILFDRRGTGLSDRVPGGELPTLEGRMDDMRAVLDAVGSSSAVVFAQGYGTPLAILFAATYPERVRRLILYSPVAKTGLRTDDYPWGSTEEEQREWEDYSLRAWGTREFARDWLRRLAPSADGDPQQIEWHARVMRAAATPAASVRFSQMSALMDVREVLGAVHVPTHVLDRADAVAPKGGADVSTASESKYVADRIPGAHFALLPGRDYLPWVGDYEALVDAVAAIARADDAVEPRTERVLLTVLFTDVVDSTRHLERLGDRGWHELRAEHDRIVAESVARFAGREIDHAGDGVFATFDGPARAIQCAAEIARNLGSLGLELRAGVHTGECELAGDRVSGIAVHLGARIAAAAGPGEILVSAIVKDLTAGSGIEFSAREPMPLKGLDGTWQLYAAAT